MVTLFGGHNYGECINRTCREPPWDIRMGSQEWNQIIEGNFIIQKSKVLLSDMGNLFSMTVYPNFGDKCSPPYKIYQVALSVPEHPVCWNRHQTLGQTRVHNQERTGCDLTTQMKTFSRSCPSHSLSKPLCLLLNLTARDCCCNLISFCITEFAPTAILKTSVSLIVVYSWDNGHRLISTKSGSGSLPSWSTKPVSKQFSTY